MMRNTKQLSQKTTNSKNTNSRANPPKRLTGFLIAGGSLAVLFAVAYLKGRADD